MNLLPPGNDTMSTATTSKSINSDNALLSILNVSTGNKKSPKLDPVTATLRSSRTATSNNQSSFDWSDFPVVNQYQAEYTPIPSMIAEPLGQVKKFTTTTPVVIHSSPCKSTATTNTNTNPVNPVNRRKRSFHDRKKVSFSSILGVRSHKVILGDHPCCHGSLPLGLGWEYDEETEMLDLDCYGNVNASSSSKRRLQDLRLTYWQRAHLLQCITGLSEQELIQQEQGGE